jgi:zinc/manganese transport system substrate-binding protein
MARSRRWARGRAPVVAALLATSLWIAASGCSASAPTSAAPAKPRVVVTTPVLGDVVRNALGDQAEIEVLVPPAVDPRTYVVSAEQRQRMPDAAVVVVNGLGVDPDLGTTLIAVRAHGHEVIEAASRLNPLPLPSPSGGRTNPGGPTAPTTTATTSPAAAGAPLGTAAPSGASVLDPHVWLDPDRMTQLARIVGDAVGPLPGVDRAEIQRRTDSYAAELAKADEAIQRALLPVPEQKRALATGRNQLGYFAERYGLDVVTTLREETGPLTAEDQAIIAAQMITADAHVILTAQSSDALGVAGVARAAGSPRIVTLDVTTLGPPGSLTDTEVKLLTVLGQQLAQALSS